jgi:hypothetical protein
MSDFSGAPSHFDRRERQRALSGTRVRRSRWTFGQRGRSKPVTGAALGAWRVAWGRAAAGG